MIRLTKREIETLRKLTEDGPLYILDIPYSKTLVPLVKLGLVTRVVFQGKVDHWGATPDGFNRYCSIFSVSSVQEAKAKAIVKAALLKASLTTRDDLE